jgi:hypothetical protein
MKHALSCAVRKKEKEIEHIKYGPMDNAQFINLKGSLHSQNFHTDYTFHHASKW